MAEKDFYPGLQAFTVATPARILGPSPATGYEISKSRGNEDDSARYILRPDAEFYRPWIANPPNGSAFVWPVGIEGFSYSSQATTGIHHYIGDNDVDIDVVYPDELHITMSGHFPGKTSVAFMHALRKVILDPSGESGKILSLPGVENQILYVTVVNHNFTHDQSDNTSSIAYTIEMIKVGAGKTISLPNLLTPVPNPSAKSKPRGKSSKQTTVKQGKRNVKQIAKKVYGSASAASVYALIQANADQLEKDGIPAYTVPFTPLGGGRTLKY